MAWTHINCALICLAAILRISSALVIEGDIVTTNSFHLLGRFCYAKTQEGKIEGRVGYTIDFPMTKDGPMDSLGILLYYKEIAAFKGAWSNTKTCVEKWNIAAGRTETGLQKSGGGNSFPLHVEHANAKISFPDKTNKTARYTDLLKFSTSMPRYFFIVLANCNPEKCNGEDTLCEGSLTGIHYKITMTNQGAEPAFMEHYSWDIDWNPFVSAVLFFLQLGLVGLAAVVTYKLHKVKKFHHSVSLLNAAIMAQTLGMLFYSVSYVVFAMEGRVYQVHTTNVLIAQALSVVLCAILTLVYGAVCHLHPVSMGLCGMLLWPAATFGCAMVLEAITSPNIFPTDDPITSQLTDVLSFSARLYTFLADFTFLLVVMILAFGWTIVRRKLSAQTRFKMVVIVSLYWCLLMGCLVWFEVWWDLASTFSIWETIPGFLVLAARMGIYLWFVVTTGATLLRFNKQKKGFYGKFFIVYSVWLVALPITCLVCSQFLPLSWRQKMLFMVNNIIALVAPAILVVLYFPGMKCSEQSFPFHATVADMSTVTLLTEDSTLDSDEEEEGDGGGKNIADGVLSDNIVNELEKLNTKKPKPTKLLPTNSKNAKTKKKKNRVNRIVSRVLTDNPTNRVDYRLDSVLFRLDRLLTTVTSTTRFVQRLLRDNSTKSPTNAEDDGSKVPENVGSPGSSTRPSPGDSRPITSSSSAAATRWRTARGIKSTRSSVTALRESVDDSANKDFEERVTTTKRARRPRRQKTTRTEAPAAAADEINDAEDEKPKRTPEEEASRRERKDKRRREKREKKKRRKRERRARRRDDDDDDTSKGQVANSNVEGKE